MTQRQYIKATAYDKRGRVISVGHNSYTRSHPMQAHFAKMVGLSDKVYLHAEVAALLKARDREVHKLTVERYHRDGSPANARPCPICSMAIKSWGVKYVEHTV